MVFVVQSIVGKTQMPNAIGIIIIAPIIMYFQLYTTLPRRIAIRWYIQILVWGIILPSLTDVHGPSTVLSHLDH